MEKSYSYIQNTTLNHMSLMGTSVKYGQQPDIAESWKQIVECDNETERYILIDRLLKKMEANSDQNGFWKPSDEIRIIFGLGNNAIHLDDRNIYYTFFGNLRQAYLRNINAEKPKNDGTLAVESIHKTIEDYFGAFNGNLALRHQLTEMDLDTFEHPSISVLQGKGCGACVEKTAVAHNLWLLMGRESYYVSSTSSKFDNPADEGHAFCIIRNTKGTFMLYDHAKSNFGALQGNPIETILSGQPLIIGKPFKNHGVYANACNIEKEQSITD